MRDRNQTMVAGLTARLEENCSGLICHLDTPRMGCYLVPVYGVFPGLLGQFTSATYPKRNGRHVTQNALAVWNNEG